MNSKKKGLGKGLSALFGDQKKGQNTNKKAENLTKALIGDLARNKYQPRTIFDDEKLKELSASIKKKWYYTANSSKKKQIIKRDI